jgi:hypothetical protein
MIIKVLFAQRKESYEGEFGPEALAVVDEFVDAENPNFMVEETERQLKQMGPGCASHAMVEIEVDQEKISEILNKIPRLNGEVKG